MKSPNKPSHPPTRTTTTEYGYFIRRKIRNAKTKRQLTTEIKKNEGKVTLCKIGEIDVYVYPHDFPDKIFLGIYPLSIQIEDYQLSQLLRAYNIMKWYLKGSWQRKETNRKGANMRRQHLKIAYNSSLKRIIDQKNELVPE